MACLLETLCNENGVSGNEHKIRDIIKQEIADYADDIKVDTMGNLIAVKHGKSERKIMLVAHMDEPGYIVSGITDTGYIKFSAVGKIDPRTIVSKRVLIGENKINGVIGMKAIHLQKKEERENVVKVSDLFIDIGAKDKKDAQKQVHLGDFIAFDTEFREIGGCVKGKALDARISCVCLIEALKQRYDCTVYAVFAVQNEIDGRGAGAAAYDINADTAIIIDTVESADMFGVKPHEKKAVLGGGAVVEKSAFKTADAVAVQTACAGIKVIRVSVPCRYSHTPVCMASKSDIKSASELIDLFVKNGDTI